VKLSGATLALWAAVLLTQATTMALHADLWWLAPLAAFASPFFLVACVGLMWSAARQEPCQALITMPDQLNPAEPDPWAALERQFGGAQMEPPPCSDHEVNSLNCGVCAAQRRAFYAALGGDES